MFSRNPCSARTWCDAAMDLYKEQPQLNKYISLRFISHVPLHVHICINTNLIPIYQYTHTHTHTQNEMPIQTLKTR